MNLPGKCWSSVGVVPSVAAILNMAAPAVLDLGQFSAFFLFIFLLLRAGSFWAFRMRSWAGVRERLGISSDRGHFFIAPQDSSLRAMEPQRVHEAGFSAQANAAPTVHEEVPLSLFCCLFGKGNVQKLTVILRLVTYAGCISAAIKSRLPWLMACQGLPKKSGNAVTPFFWRPGKALCKVWPDFQALVKAEAAG